MNTAVEIVRLSPNEWQDFKKLRLKALQAEPQAFGKSYKDALNDPDESWRNKLESAQLGKSWSIFAKVNGELVGMLTAAIHSDEDDKVWLHAMYVDIKHRGQGIGKKLMEAILKQIEEGSALKKIKLGVSKEQKAAVQLYQGFGFKVVDEQDYIMGNGEKVREFVMEKQL